MTKMPENKKPPTDFTIDCILSKSDSPTGDLPRSPTNHPMNKVLDNPWIPKCPRSLSFNPSFRRKLNVQPSPILQPNFFNIINPSTTINYTENVVNVTQNFTSVHNHFYPPSTASESTSNSDDFKLLPKFESGSLSDEKSSSDSEAPSEVLSDNQAVDLVLLPPTSPKSIHKCSVCSKSFENCELLDVG